MPFSYWATIRAERASAISAIRTTTIQNRLAKMASGLSMGGPHAKGDAFDALDVDDAAGLERARGVVGGQRAPDLVLHAHLAGFVAGHALRDQALGADHGVHVARHRVHTHAGPHPSPADEHIEDGEHRGRDEAYEGIPEQE